MGLSEEIIENAKLLDPLNLPGFAEKFLGIQLNALQVDIARKHFVAPGMPHFVVAPIGFGKTTLVLCWLIQRICQDRDETILYASKSLTPAKEKVNGIKSILRSNEKLISAYGRFYDADNEWTSGRFTVIRPGKGIVTPTVQAIGKGGTIENVRFRRGVADDVIDVDTMTSEADRRNTIDWWDSTFRGRINEDRKTHKLPIHGIGGRWHRSDIVSHIEDNDQMPISTYTCYRDWPGREESWAPDLRSVEFLREEEKQNVLFPLKYLNDPGVLGGGDFNDGWFQDRFTESELNRMKMENDWVCFQGGDNAISEKQSADYSVIVTGIFDDHGTCWVVDMARGHWKPSDLLDRYREHYLKWKPYKVEPEGNVFQKFISLALMDQYPDLGGVLDPFSVSGDKITRLRGLTTEFRNGMWKFSKDMANFSELYTEFMSFPGKHDDILDAIWHLRNCHNRFGTGNVKWSMG